MVVTFEARKAGNSDENLSRWGVTGPLEIALGQAIAEPSRFTGALEGFVLCRARSVWGSSGVVEALRVFGL